MEKKIITIISIGRSGTTFFCDFLDNAFENICSNFEIFNEKKSVVNEKILKDFAQLYYNPENDDVLSIQKNLVKFIDRENPLDYLKNIENVTNDNVICFKIFEGHLDIGKVKEILLKSTFVFFLKRNDLNNYISIEKANITRSFAGTDTSNIRIKFNMQNYTKRTERTKRWFNTTELFCRTNKISSIVINYEAFHNLTDIDKQNYLYQDIFQKYFEDSDIKPKDISNYVSKFFKQDKETSYENKIENYDEFLKYDLIL